MHIAVESLESYLAKTNSPPLVYLVQGDEPFLCMEAVNQIKAKLKSLGYTNTDILDKEYGERVWEELLTSQDNLGLFTKQKVIELRLAGVRLNREGVRTLVSFLQNIPTDTSLIIISNKLNTKEQKASWVTELNKQGLIVAANNINRFNLPKWINARLNKYNMKASTDAISTLAYYFEGNIIELANTINKLSLYHAKDKNNTIELSLYDINLFLSNSAKFSIFDLSNALLQANSQRVFKILESLKTSKAEPNLVLWAISRDIKNLEKIQAHSHNTSVDLAARKFGIWSSQVPAFRDTLNRFSKPTLAKILQQLSTLDIISKNIAPGNFWDYLQAFCLKFLNPNLLNLEEVGL